MTSPYALSAVGLAVFSALSFSASANTNDDQIIVSANRFQQPVSAGFVRAGAGNRCDP